MKFLPLVWAGLWRRPARSIFTGICIAIAFLLLGLLEGVNTGFEKSIADAHRDFLVTDTRVRGGTQFPIAAMATIKQIPGVTHVAQRAYFMAVYREPKYTLAAIATDVPLWFETRPGFAVAADHLAAMRATANGMLATPVMLQYFGWQVGDSVTVNSQTLKTDGTGNWNFQIVGTFDSVKDPGRAGFGLINYRYLDEYRVQDRGTAERFYIRIADPTKAVATAAAIDKIFANSAHETRTRSDQARAESQAKQMGDVAFFTNAVMAAVLFTLAFLTGNTLRQSLQERTPEFAVLKAMGYGGHRILSLAYLEAFSLFLPFAALGLGMAAIAAPLTPRNIGAVVVSPRVGFAGLFCACVLALLSVALPAWKLSRLSIASALGKR